MIKRKYILFRKKEQELNLLTQPNHLTPLFAQDYQDLKKAITLKANIERSVLIIGQCLLLPLASRSAFIIQSKFQKTPHLLLVWFPIFVIFVKANLFTSRLISQPFYWPFVKRTALRVRERATSQHFTLLISPSEQNLINQVKNKSYSFAEIWDIYKESKQLRQAKEEKQPPT